MDFEAILGQIMELAGPLIQMCIQICTQIVQAISGALGEGGGLKAGAAATLIGGAALTTGALQPGQQPGAPVTTASPAALSAPATIQNPPLTIQPAAGASTLPGLPNQGTTTITALNQGGA